jgi:hypothetical protein
MRIDYLRLFLPPFFPLRRPPPFLPPQLLAACIGGVNEDPPSFSNSAIVLSINIVWPPYFLRPLPLPFFLPLHAMVYNLPIL